ncbi:ABC transporter substrate-binding protein [Pannonibacter tanglangensis]|uniref:Extracellular solute-binding protein n=1 Tax=Pannonibacter tanglangensis TaxID=2750084 RepID=A0ABW9ZJS4_9HYPH|nr:ABC transporter substrate-binding protein [Pannonibacter sp. XCT-34]NBN64192.1 extracellular solute-binding protein [Pannonibacter sp. XCT-34]
MKSVFLAGAAALALMTGTAAAQELKFAPGQDSRFNWASYEALKSQDLKGQEITVLGPWLGPDKELVESVIAYFEAATGAKVNYSGSDSFEQQIVIDAEAGSPPNIAIFPQPGLARDLASKGQLAPLGADTAAWLRDNYAAGQSWVDLSTFKGKDGKEDLYGFFYKVDVKSLVWYVPENFEDAGYEVPKTMEELKALTDKIVADGGTPWCIGLGSGAATGWPATDWVEDLMLRTQSPADYDAWTSNALKFDDPKVVAAIEEFGHFARNDKYVMGGPEGVGSIDFRDSPKGLFASPPNCYMHRQASFIPSFFPDGTKVGEDVDFFYFPAYASKDLGQPVLGAGTLFSITKDSPAARAFIEFLKTPIAHEVWMAQTGFLTPFKGVNTDVYGDPTLKKMGDILLNASTFRFDGSDLMPGAIGAGAFWTGMVDYVGGKDAKVVASEIQKNWDTLKK